MRTKVTLVLLLLNIALFAWIVHARNRWRVELEDADRDRHPLRELALNLRGMTIATGGQAISLELRGARIWNITAPRDWLANEKAVTAIMAELQNLTTKLSLPVADLAQRGQSLGDYGLDKPEITLTLLPAPADSAARPPEPAVVKISAQLKGGNRYLLSPDGARVHVIDNATVLRLAGAFGGSPDPRVFTIEPFEARALRLENGPSAAVGLRREDEGWSIETLGARADKAATLSVLGQLAALRVPHEQPFVSKDIVPADIGLTTATSLHITIEGNNRHETLLLGKPIPDAPAGADRTWLFAKLEGREPVFRLEFPDALRETLARAQEKLRDRRLLAFDPAVLASVTSVTPGQPTLVLQRLDSAVASGNGPAAEPSWQVLTRGDGGPAAADRTLPADRARISNLIANLGVLQAVSFVEDAPSDLQKENYGLKRPDREITLAFNPAGKAPTAKALTLAVALGTDGNIYATAAGQRFVYALPPDTLGLFPAVARAYRERLLRALPDAARITALTLAPAAGGDPLYSHDLGDKETWPQALAAETSARRREALERLLVGVKGSAGAKDSPALLRSLRAQNFVGDSFEPTVLVGGVRRPWSWKLTLKVATPGGSGAPATYSLFLADRAGAEQQAGSPKEEADVIFTLEPALRDTLWELIYGDRDPGPPTPAAKPAPPAPPSGVADPSAPASAQR
jgi:hypothetical protein